MLSVTQTTARILCLSSTTKFDLTDTGCPHIFCVHRNHTIHNSFSSPQEIASLEAELADTITFIQHARADMQRWRDTLADAETTVTTHVISLDQ